MARFERYYSSACAVFHIEFAKNMLDVLADRAGLCTENDGNIVVAFSPRNPQEDFRFAPRQL